MAGYAKIWTDIRNDEWFMSLNCTERGVWMQLIVIAKEQNDTGKVVFRGMHGLSTALACDVRTARKIAAKMHEACKIVLIEEKNCVTIEVCNYHKWQLLDAKEHINNRTNMRQKCGKNPPLPDQSRPEQTRAGRTGENSPAPPTPKPDLFEKRKAAIRKAWADLKLDTPEGRLECDPGSEVDFDRELLKLLTWAKGHNRKDWKATIVNWINRSLDNRGKYGRTNKTDMAASVEAANRIRDKYADGVA